MKTRIIYFEIIWVFVWYQKCTCICSTINETNITKSNVSFALLNKSWHIIRTGISNLFIDIRRHQTQKESSDLPK